MRDVDVAVVGGGVIGTAIAARLSATTASVCLFERNDDVGDEASKGNAGITSSYYAEPGSLDARVIQATYRRWEDTCARLDVPFRRIGGIITALSDEEVAQLPPKLDEALGCGVRAEIIDGRRARELEPLISAECLQALWLPDEGIIDPMRLTVRLAQLAALNGADDPAVSARDRLRAVRREDRRRAHAARRGRRAVRGERRRPRPGDDQRARRRRVVPAVAAEGRVLAPRPPVRLAGLRHIVFATPLPDTKGIHVVPTTNGTALLGPSAEDNDRPTDKETDGPTLAYIYERARRMVPSVSLDYAIKTFAAIRPASDERIRVRVDAQVPNLVHAANRSTGVSSSLGIADMVLDLLNGGRAGRDGPGRRAGSRAGGAAPAATRRIRRRCRRSTRATARSSASASR